MSLPRNQILTLDSYNTAVFGSLSGNQYKYLVVSEGFFAPEPIFNDTGRSDLSPNGRTGPLPGYPGSRNELLAVLHQKALNGSLDRAEPQECMELYSQNFVSKSRNVLLVTSDENDKNTMFTYGRWNDDASVSFSWICGDGYPSNPYMADGGPVCSLAVAKTMVGNWTVLGHPISYCMVEPADENCKLRFSSIIMIVIILSNATKAGVMVWTLWKLKGPPLVCIPSSELIYQVDCSFSSRSPLAMQLLLSSPTLTPQRKACVSPLWMTFVKGSGSH